MNSKSDFRTYDPASVTILNVDDQEAARYAKTRVLQRAGYRVIEAKCGLSALQMAQERAPDVIMLDVNLPDISGFDVCRRLKSTPATEKIPVLQVSASFTSTTDQAEGLEGGADAYLTAPTDPRVLLGTVQAMVRIRLAEKQLEQLLKSEREARSEAERAGRLKDEFLATLSHELRTPLNAVIGWANLLRRSADDPEQVLKGVAVIERNAKAQATLISELLDMNRILAGKTRLERTRVDLLEIVTGTVESARTVSDAKGVSLTMAEFPVASVPAHLDAARIQQVLTNVIGNAIKFTPKGGRVLVALTSRGSAREAAITVSDSGSGINPEFLPFVFDRFRQEDSSSTRSQGGLGLGLAIVKHLVSLHGGTVRAASRGLGRGAEFTIVLPVLTNEAIGGAVPPGREAGEEIADDFLIDLTGLRILIVDDEPDAREMVRQLLAQFGGVPTLAGSAAEAMVALRAQPCDVIVSDIGMPGTDGYSFLRAVRAEGHLTPAIALTAFAREEDESRATAAGFATHLTKPFQPESLAAAIRRLGKAKP